MKSNMELIMDDGNWERLRRKNATNHCGGTVVTGRLRYGVVSQRERDASGTQVGVQGEYSLRMKLVAPWSGFYSATTFEVTCLGTRNTIPQHRNNTFLFVLIHLGLFSKPGFTCWFWREISGCFCCLSLGESLFNCWQAFHQFLPDSLQVFTWVFEYSNLLFSQDRLFSCSAFRLLLDSFFLIFKIIPFSLTSISLQFLLDLWSISNFNQFLFSFRYLLKLL